MDGMEWAFYETQSPKVTKLIQNYCKNLSQLAFTVSASPFIITASSFLTRLLFCLSDFLVLCFSFECSQVAQFALDAAGHLSASGELLTESAYTIQ